jgi:hypothetical protein
MKVFKQIISDIPHFEISSIQRSFDNLEFGGNSTDMINKMKSLRKQYPLVVVYLPLDYNDEYRKDFFKDKITYNGISIQSSTFKEDLAFYMDFAKEEGFYLTAFPPILTHLEDEVIPQFYMPTVQKVDMSWIGKTLKENKNSTEVQLS